MSLQGPHFSPSVQLIPILKAQNSGKLVSSGISDVAFVSVSSEKTRMKKYWIMIIIIRKKSQGTMVFVGRHKMSSALKLWPEK